MKCQAYVPLQLDRVDGKARIQHRRPETMQY